MISVQELAKAIGLWCCAVPLFAFLLGAALVCLCTREKGGR